MQWVTSLCVLYTDFESAESPLMHALMFAPIILDPCLSQLQMQVHTLWL